MTTYADAQVVGKSSSDLTLLSKKKIYMELK